MLSDHFTLEDTLPAIDVRHENNLMQHFNCIDWKPQNGSWHDQN
jgi:hypothetical protein